MLRVSGSVWKNGREPRLMGLGVKWNTVLLML